MATPEDGWVDVTQKYNYPGKVEKKHLDDFVFFTVEGMSFKSNLAYYKEKNFKERGAKYFLMIMEDMEEFEHVQKDGSRAYSTDLLDNWTKHAKNNPKRLVVRGFVYREIGPRIVHVLTDDVLELILILMERQKRMPGSYKEMWLELAKNWKVENPNMSRSISVEEFKKIMDKFAIDKAQIVIAPDIQSYLSTLRTLYDGAGPITTYNRDGKLIMTAHQAFLHIFQTTVYGYNWHDLQINSNYKRKFDEYYKFFGEVTKKYLDMEEGLLVTMSLVEEDIGTLKGLMIFKKKWAKKARLYPYENSKYYDEIPVKHLKKDCENLDISFIRNLHNLASVPVYGARANILYGYTEIFYPDKMIKEKMALVDGLLTVMDFRCRQGHRKLLQKVIHENAGKEMPQASSESDSLSDSVLRSDDAEDKKKEPASTEVLHSIEQDKPATSSPSMNNNSRATSESAEPSKSADDSKSNHCSKNSELCMVVPNNFDLATAVAKSHTFKIVSTCCGSVELVPFTAPPPKPKVISHPVLLSDRCNQCFENLGKMKAAEKKQKDAENKAKLYEKQANKTEELEMEMKKLSTKREHADKHRKKAGEEMEKAVNLATKNEKKAQKADELEQKLKEKNAKLSENKKEIEELKMTIRSQPDLARKIVALEKRLANREVIENQLRESNKEFKSEISDLKKKLESESQKNELDQEQFANKYGKMEDDMAGNRQLIDELVTQTQTLTKDNDQLKASALVNQAALKEKADINARLLNEKVQLHQKIKDLERQLQKLNGDSGSQ